MHVRDTNNETPLLAAVKSGHLPIVRVRIVLRKIKHKTSPHHPQTLALCGAHLGQTPGDLSDLLVGSAGQGKLELVAGLLVAGADPNIASMGSGNTALHAAVEVG